MKNISAKARIFLATLIAFMAPALIVYAALNTLNGQNGAAVLQTRCQWLAQ
jgi:hypothetical protein